jgi:HK97 family phage major capsid protein
MEITKEQLESLLEEQRTSILTAIPDEVKKAALHEEESRKKTAMVFGRDNKKAEELTGDELIGQWMLHKVMALKEPWRAPEHLGKALALSKHSWQNCKDPKYAALREKALTIATEGADLTPVEYIAQMIEKAPEISELMPYVRRIPVTSDTGTVPKEGAAVTVRWARTEGSAMTASDPAYANVGYTAYEVYLYTEVSYMMLADSPVAVVADVTRRFMNALLEEQDTMVATGSGTNRPTGIASASITQSAALSNSITFAGLGTVEDLLPPKYRKNARWIGHPKVIDYMKRLTDTQGRPIFTAQSEGGKPAKIMNYPFSMEDSLPTTDLWLGDVSYYYWFDRMLFGLESDSGGKYFEQGTTAIKMVGRFDGKVALEDAFARGKSITGIS